MFEEVHGLVFSYIPEGGKVAGPSGSSTGGSSSGVGSKKPVKQVWPLTQLLFSVAFW